jgi:uncharacterized protein (DUF1778 family)
MPGKSTSKPARAARDVRKRKGRGVAARLTPDGQEALERAAVDQHRNRSNMLELVLIEWLTAHGYLTQ